MAWALLLLSIVPLQAIQSWHTGLTALRVGAVFKRLDELNRVDNQAATSALQQQGINFVMPKPGEIERWREISDRSIDEMVESGVMSATVVEQLRTHLREFRDKP